MSSDCINHNCEVCRKEPEYLIDPDLLARAIHKYEIDNPFVSVICLNSEDIAKTYTRLKKEGTG